MSYGGSEDGETSPYISFKLLNILPPITQSDEEIICELSWKSLYNAPKYEALSYTWGTTAQDQPIQIRTISSQFLPSSSPTTEIVHVTKHLRAALLRLRQNTVSRRVWIDQLCIDQNNITEKNAQVKLMADIYQRAQQTVVWLGESDMLDVDKEAIISATERMNFRPLEREYSTLEDQDILTDLIGFKAQGDAHSIGQRRRGILAGLLNRPWFTRAWVYQEVVVAQRGVVLCGSIKMDMDIFINLLDGVCELDFREAGEAASIMHSSKGYKPMYAIREARFESRYGLSLFGKSRWLSTLWQAMGNLHATNPRDKVYAFLAFADSKEEARISPSYGKPITSVYTDATLRSISSVGSLDVLELAIKGDKTREGLPSWVPDFSKPLPSQPFMTHNVGSTGFHASRDSTHTSTTSNTESTSLTVRGHTLSTVAFIHPMNFHNHKPSQTLHDWFNLADVTAWVESVQRHPTSSNFPENPEEPPSTLKMKVLRTLFAEGAGSDDKPSNLRYTDSEAILQVYENESSILSAKANNLIEMPFRETDSACITALKIQYSYYQWMRKVLKIMLNKKFFLSADGSLGLAYEAIREGDLICILYGSKTPTVLRKADYGGDGYRFVAQCFVDECMRGEPYEERGWTEENAATFTLI
ncbi:MAG: hypothetical protein Q9209_004065 [Squamulea sp. 1 TL-2023]